MGLFKVAFAIISLFFGGIAAFVGAAVSVLALRSGEIGVSFRQGAGTAQHLARRATEPAQFWSDVTWFGFVPLVVGTMVAWYAWRKLKGQ